MSKVVHLDVDSFKSEVLEGTGVVLVDFWASWCGPCKMLGPILDELSQEVSVKIAKVNVDDYPNIAADYGIRSIPTMIIFKDGEKIDQLIGLMQKGAIKEKLEQY
ncbi:thioredoxin [Propionigenium maris DSM 9537]|uniref:Thioredoxin n=1 Tax=Propionigenium maris DSM 9537 TaxID=1123000 RepID=A0A9W6GKQ1_9FUSO|nr:thioredoxin [Propionigenium maris DSM 9537]